MVLSNIGLKRKIVHIETDRHFYTLLLLRQLEEAYQGLVMIFHISFDTYYLYNNVY